MPKSTFFNTESVRNGTFFFFPVVEHFFQALQSRTLALKSEHCKCKPFYFLKNIYKLPSLKKVGKMQK